MSHEAAGPEDPLDVPFLVRVSDRDKVDDRFRVIELPDKTLWREPSVREVWEYRLFMITHEHEWIIQASKTDMFWRCQNYRCKERRPYVQFEGTPRG
jgi:hypothetical protein